MKILKKFEKQIAIAFVFGFLVALSLALFGDFKKTTKEILSFNFFLVVPILLLTLINYFFRFLRWHYFLSVIKISNKIHWKESMLIFLSGLSMTVTPGRAGEIIKAYLLKRILKNHFSETIPVIVIERATDGMAAVFLMAGGLIIHKYGIPIFFISMFVSVTFVFILQQRNLCLAILKFLERIKFLAPFMRALERFYETSFVLVRWKNIGIAVFLGIIAWGAESVGLFLVLKGLGIETNLRVLFTTFFIFCFSGIVGFATLLPGGLGVSEGTTTGLLMLLVSLQRSTAVAATLLIRTMTLWFGVAIGMTALFNVIRNQKYND